MRPDHSSVPASHAPSPPRRPGLKKIVVVGHPLAAEENRLAFRDWKRHQVDLILPRLWRARSLGHDYVAPSGTNIDLAADLAAARTTEPAAELSLHPLDIHLSGRNSLFLWRGLGPLLQRLKPDVIYCWEEPWCLATWQVVRQARSLGVPVVFYTAENRPKRLPWPFRLMLRTSFRYCAACVAPTEEIAARLKAWGYRGRVFTIPLWIRPRRALRADVAVRCLAYVGRLIPLKRVDLLVESLALLPGFRLRIIGDGPERRRLADRVGELGMQARVEFRGHLDNAMLEDGLEGASLLVLPTAENARQAEQFGKAAVEGVSCGLPVLASRTGNLASLAGIFPTLSAVELDSPERLAEAVSGIFRAFPEEAELAESRRLALAAFGPAAAAGRLESAFASLSGAEVSVSASGAPQTMESHP
ncbi:MAG: glycosyltransferase [Fibrobacteria bacterium]